MSNLKIYLKVLEKFNYPDPNPNCPSIARMLDYNLPNFVNDLVDNIGMNRTKEFIEKTFSSLGLMGDGMKIDLNDIVGEYGSYIYLIINDFDIVLDEEDSPVWIHYTWGDSNLIHDGVSKTLQDIYDEIDLGTMGEYSELIDEIQEICKTNIYEKAGFWINFDSEI